MGSGLNKDVLPILHNNSMVVPEELTEEIDYIEAILKDDKIVHLVGHERLRVGAPGTCENANISSIWFWIDEIQGPEGLYELIKEIPYTISKVVEERKKQKKPYKRWRKDFEFLGLQLIEDFKNDDVELLNEIMEDGLLEWLRNYKTV